MNYTVWEGIHVDFWLLLLGVQEPRGLKTQAIITFTA
jgi:hypothetical protein